MSRHRKLNWGFYVQIPGCSVVSFASHFQRPNVWAVSSTERDLTQSWTDGFEQALGWECLNFLVNFIKKRMPKITPHPKTSSWNPKIGRSGWCFPFSKEVFSDSNVSLQSCILQHHHFPSKLKPLKPWSPWNDQFVRLLPGIYTF